MRRDLPSGTVTFLFTDVEGSTRLLHELGAERYAQALADHRRSVREAFAAHGGVEVDTQGDAFFVAFPTADGALRAAAAARSALAAGPIRVRMGIHTGRPHVAEEGYVGADVHRAARIGAVGHGGQVVVSAATAASVGTDALIELGEHRLKDFDQPVPLYQLGDESFPPLKTISNTNLPRPASSFVGREREVGEVSALLREDARLVTLTGPGGTGKTRLAIEAAAAVVPDFKAGVFWVGLASLADPALVAATIAKTLGAKDGLAEHIGDRELLLLLDNLEHVIEAATELAPLLETCPNLSLLVTSRERLRVKGEIEYPVAPLAEREAVELFSARARTDPSETVHELCRALDNLPLAVELAAARASVLSPQQILERLSRRLDVLKGGRDADPRQQTLRSTIEWSHELLSAEERRLFARLAVFRGGCTLDAAEAVVEADLDVLQSLVDKSLVRRTDDHFWMLETIREYASERFDELADANELRRRHAEYFLALAEAAEPELRAESQEWLDRLESEHDNIRAAFDRLEASGDGERLLTLAAAVWRFWSLRGHLAEGRRRVETALRGDERPSAARAAALAGAADLALDTEDLPTARLRGEQALAVNRELGDTWGVAESLLLIGLALALAQDWSGAQERLEESARLFERLGDEHHRLHVTRRLAWVYERLGDLDRSRALHEENLVRARAVRNEHMEAQSLAVLAQLALEEGRVDDDVVSTLTDAYRIHRKRRDLPDRYCNAVIVCRFARAVALMGRAEPAVRLLSCAEELFEEIGMTMDWWLVEMNEQTLARARAQLDEAALADARQRGRALTLDDAVALALDCWTAARGAGALTTGSPTADRFP